MALDVTIFEKIYPSRFLSFTIPNPTFPPPLRLLRVAVLDSPFHPTESQPRVAAMMVPKHRETDWIFSTESGHLQLLLNLPDFSRLILIGDEPVDGSASVVMYHRDTDEDDGDRERLEQSLKPLVLALSPKNQLGNGIPDIPFLSYEDHLICSVKIEKSIGKYVGEMLVEDVEIEIDNVREFRRRLRFKRMPNLVQTDIRIIPITPNSVSISRSTPLQGTKFRPDLTVLVHPYLAPMVASLSLIGSHIDELTQNASSRPKALCIGIGGGALLSFLRLRLDFDVTGVEIDEDVLSVARRFFGFKEDIANVHVEDGIEFLENVSGDKFDVVMVDLDSTDPMHGVTAPPLEFVSEEVLLAARTVLVPSGILVINVIPPNQTFYDRLKDKFRRVFAELYEINVDNGENYVLIATIIPLTFSVTDTQSDFTKKLTQVVPRKFLNTIERI